MIVRRLLVVALLLICSLSYAEEKFDKYGGSKGIKGNKTGYFHLEKNNQRWMFYTPEGNGFIPLSISCMHLQPAQWNGAMRDGSSYRDSALKKHKTLAAWKTATAKRIRSWGFNATGCFSSTTLESENVPYQATLNLTRSAVDHRAPVCGNMWYELGINYVFPDLWNPELPVHMASHFLKHAKKTKDDPFLLYYYPDEPDQLKGFAPMHANIGWAALIGEESLSSSASKSSAVSLKNPKMFPNHTKPRFIKYLKTKYATIALLNKAWGVSFKSFDDILKVRRDDAKWGRGLNPIRKEYPKYRKDLDGFISVAAEKYALLVDEAVRKNDDKHLIGFQIYGNKPHEAVLKGLKKADKFDFYVVDWGAETYAKIGRPFVRLLYLSACEDSPLRFSGSVSDSELCLDAKGEKPVPAAELEEHKKKNTRLYVKIFDDKADLWFKLKYAGGRLPIFFYGVEVPRTSIDDPWRYQVLYTGKNKDGRSWFTVRSWGPFGSGRAWELKEGLDKLKAAGKAGTYRRSTAVAATDFDSQEKRGKWWSDQLQKIVDDKAANGDHYRLGAEWWKYMDNGWTYWVEEINWGLVTLRDNAYDGKEATKLGADGKAGTWDDETQDYGDGISLIRDANLKIYEKILNK